MPLGSDTVKTQVYLPRALKRQAFAAFALRDLNFSRWARQQLEGWLKAQEAPQNNATETPGGEPTHG
jgi:hypothetical protein